MKRALVGSAVLLLLTPLLTGCLGDYFASGECDDLAGELSPVIEESLGSAPTIDSTWGDGGMTPWCVIEVTTADVYSPEDVRLAALKSDVEAGIRSWPSDVVITIHISAADSIEVLSPAD